MGAKPSIYSASSPTTKSLCQEEAIEDSELRSGHSFGCEQPHFCPRSPWILQGHLGASITQLFWNKRSIMVVTKILNSYFGWQHWNCIIENEAQAPSRRICSIPSAPFHKEWQHKDGSSAGHQGAELCHHLYETSPKFYQWNSGPHSPLNPNGSGDPFALLCILPYDHNELNYSAF